VRSPAARGAERGYVSISDRQGRPNDPAESKRVDAWRRRGANIPTNIDAERFVLGSILTNETIVAEAMADLSPGDFALEKHRRIFRRACDVYGREESVNRVAVANELMKHDELEPVDGLTYLVSLDDGLPQVPNVESYIRILKEKAASRQILWICQNLTNRIQAGDMAAEVATGAQEAFGRISATGAKALRVPDLPTIAAASGGSEGIEYMRRPELPCGAVVGVTGDAGAGKSSLVTAWARDTEVPVLFLDRENPLSVVAERFERLRWRTDDPRVKFWGGWCMDAPPLPDDPRVIEWLEACDPKPLVVADTYSAFQAGDQNDSTACRAFMNRCRRLAARGATVVVLHHSGKGESSKDYRGSSDFSGALDLGFHVSNIGANGELGRLLVRPFKTRIYVEGTLVYDYAGGRFTRVDRGEAQQTITEQLTALLRLYPGATVARFDELAKSRCLGRDVARNFLNHGVLSRTIRRENGPNNAKRHYLAVHQGDFEVRE
jgi:DnaB-like helicase N terminal domain/AAA domain